MQTSVVTIHGIDSAGTWQGDIDGLLRCHFRHVAVKYPQYRWCGATKLILEPWFLLIGGALLGWACWVGILRKPIIIAAAAVLLLVGAHAFSYLRRARAIKTVRLQLDQVDLFDAPPHLIAHSFGTALSAISIDKYDTAFDRIVLVGGVIPVDLDWRAFHDHGRIGAVWNEVGSADWVVRLAKYAGKLVKVLGHSGLVGFVEEPTLTHRMTGPSALCTECSPQQRAPVHNVNLNRYSHFDALATRKHAARYWLPFFWQVEPAEYRRFLNLCLRAARYDSEVDSPALTVVESELSERPWRWAAGKSIAQLIDDHLKDYLNRHLEVEAHPEMWEDLSSRAIARLWHTVWEAAQNSKEANPDPYYVAALKPSVAVGRAVLEVLESEA
jgi:pimeloyl-ACP methyl ester carboxylesterase